MDEHYVDQVRLLLRIAARTLLAEDVFALKGGTAISLFYREMPRLSVDIDLANLPVEEREKSLQDINGTLDRIVAAIGAALPKSGGAGYSRGRQQRHAHPWVHLDAFAQVRTIRVQQLRPRRPRIVARRLQSLLEVLAHGLAVQARVTRDRQNRYPLVTQLMNHE